jgi:repressor LexA
MNNDPRALLTDKQKEVLSFIEAFIDGTGYPPTVREIGDRFGINSPNGVMCHLKALKKKGLIERDNHNARSIRVTSRKHICPHCGKEIE